MLSILLGLGHVVAAIPTACLAAILFKLGVDILDYRILPVLKKLPITDLLVFIIVFRIQGPNGLFFKSQLSTSAIAIDSFPIQQPA